MGPHLPPRRRPVVAATALPAAVLAVLLAACSDGDSDDGGTAGAPPASPPAASASGSAQHNDADVSFVTGMLPRHQQAVQLAELATTKADNPLVKALAARVMATQNPEVPVLTGWLTEWGQPVPGASAGGDQGTQGKGLATEQELTDLAAATGPAFDRMFLELMVRHHEGAIELAGVEQQQGQHPAVKQFAAKVEADQSAEMRQLKDLLDRL